MHTLFLFLGIILEQLELERKIYGSRECKIFRVAARNGEREKEKQSEGERESETENAAKWQAEIVGDADS